VTVSCRPGDGGVVELVAATNRHRKGPRWLLRRRLHRRRNLRRPLAARDDGSGCGDGRGGDDGRAGAVATVVGCPPAVPGRSSDALRRYT